MLADTRLFLHIGRFASSHNAQALSASITLGANSKPRSQATLGKVSLNASPRSILFAEHSF
jgi:hypothetical protein